MTDLPYDTILHIGAGIGQAVPDWLAAGALRIILVEPNPALIPNLNRLADSYPQVEVIEAAISGQDGEALLRVFNLARHSSLVGATGLTDLLPGLRQTALVPVTTLTPDSLLNRLGPLTGSVAVLLDAPGMELPILQGLQACDALDGLHALDLICTEEPQYQGAVGRPVLQALLQDAGFTLTAADTSDPDWPHLSFRIDHKARQIAALTAQIAALTTSHQTLEQSLADQQTAAILQDQDHAQTVTALHDQLQAARDAHGRLAVELATAKAAARQLELALTEAEGGNAKADQDSAILRNALDTAQSERFAAARRIDILEQRLAEEHRAKADLVATADRAARSSIAQSDLTAERDKSASLTRQVQELTAELATSGAQAAGYQQRITALEAAIASVKSAPDPQASATQTIADQAQRIKDLEFRQTLARDELRRSEGQLDLIKDLLLRGERL